MFRCVDEEMREWREEREMSVNGWLSVVATPREAASHTVTPLFDRLRVINNER